MNENKKMMEKNRIKLYGHYYKRKRHTDNLAERITVIAFDDDGCAVCVKGHISPNDKVYQTFRLSPKNIKLYITDEEKSALMEYDKIIEDIKRSERAVKENKKRQYQKYIERYNELTELLFAKGVIIPILSCFENDVLERLLNNTEYYIPELKEGMLVKVIGYNRKRNCFAWIIC